MELQVQPASCSLERELNILCQHPWGYRWRKNCGLEIWFWNKKRTTNVWNQVKHKTTTRGWKIFTKRLNTQRRNEEKRVLPKFSLFIVLFSNWRRNRINKKWLCGKKERIWREHLSLSRLQEQRKTRRVLHKFQQGI